MFKRWIGLNENNKREISKHKYKVLTTKYNLRIEDAKINYLKQVYGDVGITKLIDTLIDEKIAGDFTKPKKLRSPIPRIGAKGTIAHKIVDLFPPQETYKVFIDLFGGGGSILLAKPRGGVEIMNDINQDITVLFKEIKNHPMQLRDKILEMPISRSYFNEIRKVTSVPKDDLEKAARAFYVIRNSFYGNKNQGFRSNIDRNSYEVTQRIADELIWISERLRDVFIECRDWRYFFDREKYNNSNTFFFVDSPYILFGKKNNALYETGFTIDDNREIARKCNDSQAKICVNHYDHYLYNRWYKDWNRHQIEVPKRSAKEINGKKPRVLENFYYNYDL